MTGISSSAEPLFSDNEDLRHRSTSTSSATTTTTDNNNIEKNLDLNNKLKAKQREDKHLFNIKQIKNSEKLDKSTIQLSLAFYVLLFLLSLITNYTSHTSNSNLNLISISIFNFLKNFYKLSYKIENSKFYHIGFNDFYFTIFWIINLLFLRSFLIIYCFKPCAKILGIKKFKATQRFIEQTWSIFYYSLSWSLGFYLYYNSNYFFNCYNIYSNWPHNKLSGLFKFYYLVQTANWFQQFIIIFLEAKRKDHYQMVSHHVITILLCTGSYCCYFTKIGHIILLLMDIVDVFLSTAKILKYCGFQTICDLMFVIFMISWIILRHGVYIYVLWFSWLKARIIMNADCSKFSINDKLNKTCYTDFQIDIFLLLLAFLQLIMGIWMYMILRVAIRVIRGGSADDVRSDSEDD